MLRPSGLSDQPGYPLSIDETTANIKAVINSNDRAVFVAEHEDKVIGWIGCTQAIMIEVKPQCEVTGLVIDKDFQGKGIGKLLLNRQNSGLKKKEITD